MAFSYRNSSICSGGTLPVVYATLITDPPPIEGQEFGHFCKIVINLINQRDFNFSSKEARHLRSRISPDWACKMNCSPFTVSFEDQIEIWEQMTLEFPDVYFELLGVDCKINEKQRTADVIMRTAMMRGGIKLLTACELKWKWSSGRWMWWYHSGMRGVYAT